MNKIDLISQENCEIFLCTDIYNKLPIRSTPYDRRVDFNSQGYPERLRVYGASGDIEYDYDFNDHKRPKFHYFPKYNGAHKHHYYYQNNELNKTEALELTEEEYLEFVKPYI